MITLEKIEAAAEAIRGRVVETPCVHSRALSLKTGTDLWLKLENLQFTGSFKDRGALVKLLSLSPEECRRGVIAMSAGNHAQAVAYHARELGIPAVILMPRFTPNVKVARTRAFGPEVILHGDSVSEAGERAREIAAQRDLVFVHPYDDPLIIAGQGTIGLEILADNPELEVLVVPVGGGGLISGIASAVKASRPELQIIGVETVRFPSMLRAMQGQPAEFGQFTIAEGIAIKQPGGHTLPIVRELVDELLLVDEDDIEQAVLLLLEEEKTVAEGAGAVPLAALRRHPEYFVGRRVGLVVSGGNIDLPILSAIIQRGLVRSGRLARLTVEIRDIPGELAKAAGLIGGTGANIVQVNHQRIFTGTPLQGAELHFVLQSRGPDHIREVVEALRGQGYSARVQGAGQD